MPPIVVDTCFACWRGWPWVAVVTAFLALVLWEVGRRFLLRLQRDLDVRIEALKQAMKRDAEIATTQLRSAKLTIERLEREVAKFRRLRDAKGKFVKK